VQSSNKPLLVLSVILCLLTIKTTAQVLKPAGNGPHNLGLNFGFDNNLISVNLRYAYSPGKYKAAPFIDFTQGTSLIGTGNFKTKIGLQSWQGSSKKFNFKNSIALVYTQSVNKAGNYAGLGVNIVSNPGFRFKKFGVGADFQYSPFLFTRIKHSDYYREHYYGNVKDGCYNSTAQNLRLGLYIGRQVGRNNPIELNIRGGFQKNGKYDKFVPNAYATIEINKSFN
jgi:hypothetical protein